MTRFPIAPEDIVAAAGFLTVVIGALAIRAVRVTLANSPRARMRQRALAAAALGPASAHGDTPVLGLAPADSHVRKLVARALAEAEKVGGGSVLNTVAAMGLAAMVLGVVVGRAAGLPGWLTAVAAPLDGLVAAGFTFRVVTHRYQQRFLAGFPEALELIVRAVRAGVPVVQAVRTAGRELPYPVGREFRLVSDGLSLGLDQDEVMEAAAKRIRLPDFQFFVVCLQLQRETGGPLAETLENLAAIIRARRETRMKTRALTAQSRSASKIIASVPLVTMGGMQALDPEYLSVLFTTASGRHVLWACAALVVVGLVVIQRMGRIED